MSVDTATDLQVTAVDAELDPRWTSYVAAHRDGCAYFHPHWLRALQAEVARPQVHLVCEDQGGELQGVLPMAATRGLPRLGGIAARRWASLPRTPIGGPLASSAAAAEALVSAAVEIAAADRALLQLKRLADPDRDWSDLGVAARPWRCGYVLDLPETEDELRFGSARNDRRIRWAVGKAARSGVEIRRGGPGDVGAWYRLYLHTMRRHRVPPRARGFFEALCTDESPFELLLAERREPSGTTLLAGSFFGRFGGTVSYAFNGVDPDARSHRPNDVLQWRAIHRAVADGFRRYDLGEVAAGEAGLADFKRKWGATQVQIVHHYRPDPGPVDGPPSDRRVLAALWGRLPLTVTRTVGAVVNARL